MSGVPSNYLSLIEQGRLVPTGDQYDAVTKALREIEAQKEPA